MYYKRFKETDIGSFNRLPKHIKLKRTGEGGFRLKRKRLKSKSPLVSIITVTFNSEKYLEDTIKSIQNLMNMVFSRKLWNNMENSISRIVYISI